VGRPRARAPGDQGDDHVVDVFGRVDVLDDVGEQAQVLRVDQVKLDDDRRGGVDDGDVDVDDAGAQDGDAGCYYHADAEAECGGEGGGVGLDGGDAVGSFGAVCGALSFFCSGECWGQEYTRTWYQYL
jgi:hypothetical protein